MSLRSFHPCLTKPLLRCTNYRPRNIPCTRPNSSQSSSSAPPSNRSPKYPVQRLRSHLQAFHRTTLKPRIDIVHTEATARLQKFVTSAAQHATVLGLKLNEVTGYQEVERLKALVTEQGEQVSDNRPAPHHADCAFRNHS